MAYRMTIALAALALAACGGDRTAAGNDAAANGAASANEAAAAANPVGASGATALAGCPFQETSDWAGSVEGGRMLVTGTVDLQMAGFRPGLTERAGAPAGTIAFDLTLAPEANAAVTDQVRYERAGGGGYRRGEIWCGGRRLAGFDIVHVG
jgi:hypothetical protein